MISSTAGPLVQTVTSIQSCFYKHDFLHRILKSKSIKYLVQESDKKPIRWVEQDLNYPVQASDAIGHIAKECGLEKYFADAAATRPEGYVWQNELDAQEQDN